MLLKILASVITGIPLLKLFFWSVEGGGDGVFPRISTGAYWLLCKGPETLLLTRN